MKYHRQEKIDRDVLQAVTCEVCDKHCDATHGNPPEGWYEFSSYHGDWGNDSIDSHNYWDVCSWKCYIEKVTEIFNEYSSRFHPTLIVDGKDYEFIRGLVKGDK